MTIDGQTIIVIPARYASTRFPGKPLYQLRGPSGESKALIQWTYETACRVPEVDAVYVATDSTDIQAAAEAFGASVIMTPFGCRNGTERCAAALGQLVGQPKLVVNVQGDAPLTPPAVVSALINHAEADTKSAVWTPALHCSLVHYERLQADAQRGIVGATTVVRTEAGRALYFSKQLIPHLPSSALTAMEVPVLLHMGIYAYSPASLGEYACQPETQLERLEGLEQLRFLDIGVPVHVLPVNPPAWDIWELNNESDVPIIEAGLAKMLMR